MLSPKNTLKDSWKNLKLPRTPLHNNAPHTRFSSTTRLSSFSPSRVSTPTNRSPSPSSSNRRLLPEIKMIKGLSRQDMQKIYQTRCKDLNILQNQIQEFRFYKSCEKNLRNRVFNMKDQELRELSGLAIGEILQGNCEFCRVCLSNNHLGDKGVGWLVELICKNESIIWIDLSSNDLTPTGFDTILKSFIASEFLVFLDLSSYNGLNRNKFGILAGESLENLIKKSPVLQVLLLNEVNLTDYGLEKLAAGLAENKSIIKLSLINNYITHKPMEVFSKAVQESNLTYLNLMENKISDQGVRVLGTCLSIKDFDCKINTLDLSKNEISHIGCSEFLDANRYNPHLKYLNLGHNPLGCKLGQSLHFFLLSNFSLTELNLNSCNLKCEGLNHLSLGLSKNKRLISLSLSKNSIEDISMLCESLCENDVLEALDLSNNYIKDGEMLAKTLKKNKKLEILNLSENRIKEEDGLALVEAIKFAQRITKCSIDGNYFSVWTIKELKALLKINEDLKISKKNPDLQEKLNKLQIDGLTAEEVKAKARKKEAQKLRSVNKMVKLKETLTALKKNHDPVLEELKAEQDQAIKKKLELNTELESLSREFRKYLKLEDEAKKEKHQKISEIDSALAEAEKKSK